MKNIKKIAFAAALACAAVSCQDNFGPAEPLSTEGNLVCTVTGDISSISVSFPYAMVPGETVANHTVGVKVAPKDSLGFKTYVQEWNATPGKHVYSNTFTSLPSSTDYEVTSFCVVGSSTDTTWSEPSPVRTDTLVLTAACDSVKVADTQIAVFGSYSYENAEKLPIEAYVLWKDGKDVSLTEVLNSGDYDSATCKDGIISYTIAGLVPATEYTVYLLVDLSDPKSEGVAVQKYDEFVSESYAVTTTGEPVKLPVEGDYSYTSSQGEKDTLSVIALSPSQYLVTGFPLPDGTFWYADFDAVNSVLAVNGVVYGEEKYGNQLNAFYGYLDEDQTLSYGYFCDDLNFLIDPETGKLTATGEKALTIPVWGEDREGGESIIMIFDGMDAGTPLNYVEGEPAPVSAKAPSAVRRK